ncbi:MAG: C4-dicarboxylate ABC transporter [Weeksellaceae bacterium]
MIKNVINIVMGLLYAFIGVFVMMKEWFLTELSPIAAQALGVLFIVYGSFRIYRAIKDIRANRN